MRKLIILRGVSGAGKSTYAKHLVEIYEQVFSASKCYGGRVKHIEADQFFYDDLGNYNFDANKLQHAHSWCKSTVQAVMSIGLEVIIVSNTSTTEKELEPYIELAEIFDYEITSLVVENRHGNIDVHAVPENVKQKQAMRLKNNLKLM